MQGGAAPLPHLHPILVIVLCGHGVVVGHQVVQLRVCVDSIVILCAHTSGCNYIMVLSGINITLVHNVTGEHLFKMKE